MRRTIASLIVVALGFSLLSGAAPAAEVVGGRPASRPYPHMVSLQAKNGDHFCGGSLIRSDVVLTAAHCAEGEKPKALEIVIGSTKLSKPGDEIAVRKIVVHKLYPEQGTHDVALLKLATEAKQRPIEIAPRRESWRPGKVATAIGWGTSAYLVGPEPDELHEVEVPVVDDADCARAYDNFFFGFDRGSMVCAGEDTGGKDTCQGDSGGPLMVRDGKGRFVQMGVVSFGLGCGFPLFYGVYARIADKQLSTWVDDQLTKL